LTKPNNPLNNILRDVPHKQQTAKGESMSNIPIDDKITIHNLLSSVMANIGEIQKTGENTGLNYTYASEADLLNAIQPQLANHGVMLRKSASEIILNDFDSRGRHRFMIKIEWSFERSDAETGIKGVADALLFTSFKTESYGYAECKQGFAPAKAQTQALKYVMRQTFCIPTGDDPDITAGIDTIEAETKTMIFLNVPFSEKDEMKEAGRSNNIRTIWDKESKTWSVEDSEKSRDIFKRWIDSSMIVKMKSWADKNYDGFEMMADFCHQKSASKSRPENWSDELITSFMEQMDIGNGVYDSYCKWKSRQDASIFDDPMGSSMCTMGLDPGNPADLHS
jgi:hypothetical protein